MECVESYKYLGTIIESKLNFEANSEALCQKGHQRLYCLRKMSYFNIADKTMLTQFDHAFIKSVLCVFFGVMVWHPVFKGQTQTESDSEMVQSDDWWASDEPRGPVHRTATEHGQLHY